MVKVLKEDVYRQRCDSCGAELEFSYDDTYIGYLGARYVKCPVCGREIITEKIGGIYLNSSNIEFPKHFDTCKDGVDISNEEIQKWVRECLERAEKASEPYNYFLETGSGNAVVILLAYEDEYEIIVAKDYYETSIERDTCLY